MDPKNNRKQIASQPLLCQHKTMTRDIRHVVTNMTVMTARPVYRKKANNRLKYISNLISVKICIDLSYILLRKLPYKNRIVSLFI